MGNKQKPLRISMQFFADGESAEGEPSGAEPDAEAQLPEPQGSTHTDEEYNALRQELD